MVLVLAKWFWYWCNGFGIGEMVLVLAKCFWYWRNGFGIDAMVLDLAKWLRGFNISTNTQTMSL